MDKPGPNLIRVAVVGSYRAFRCYLDDIQTKVIIFNKQQARAWTDSKLYICIMERSDGLLFDEIKSLQSYMSEHEWNAGHFSQVLEEARVGLNRGR